MLLAYSWVLVACFLCFQYNREKQYKAELLDGQLQIYNAHLIDALANDTLDFSKVEKQMPLAGMRVSVIGSDGTLLFDNTLDKLPGQNHLGRHEIAEAMVRGHGYTVRRHSAVNDQTYFYSATKNGDIIVRSAVPYSLTLQEVLNADSSFLWFMLVVTLVMSVAGYFATLKIGRTITRLNRFAERAERGERIYYEDAFPHDELGSISHHIVRLYAQLQQTMNERNREHSLALHEQQEKTRIKKQLTNNINHELKTPVAAIKICLETLTNHPNLSENQQRELLRQCNEHNERLINLLNDVASITRMDDGAANIEKADINLAELVRHVVSTVKTDMHISLSLPEIMPINGNRSFLDSIFRNLIDNAINYSGGSQITIVLESDTAKYYTISVADNGSGISPEHLDRIFERFYRVDKGRSRTIGGTGLGLSIVRNAIQLHGGSIQASNVVSGGLKFVFTLAKH